jgi:two-component system, NtrC family, sensor histidine kinase KinB
MFNLTQRLTLGCTLLVALSITLAVWVHRELAPAGTNSHTTRSLLILWILSGGAILVAGATLIFVLQPIRQLSRDVRRIASGDLAHRTEWNSQGKSPDSFSLIADEMNRLAVRLRELRETEAGRRQMEFQLSDAVLQSIFEPIIVTDSKGHVLKTNPSAAQLLGAAADDRMALTNTPGGDKILEAIRNAVSMQRAVAAEDDAAMLPMRIGERERSYRLRTTPMRDSDGRLLGAVTTLEDVTSLQDTDRFKTQFIAMASKKLRDPLLRLRRGLYALGQGFAGELRPLQIEVVSAATQESQALDDLMGDLIEVAELDSGKRVPELERLRPFVVLTEARDAAADDAASRGIRLEIRAFADLSFIQADRRAVRTILDNLLVNALRYTPAGGEVTLEAEERKKFVQFTVRDTGRGIAPDRLSTIFDRFNAFSDGGSGLGLALVRRLVESHGGQISVKAGLAAAQPSTSPSPLPPSTPAVTRSR